MSLTVTQLERRFRFNGRALADPNPKLTPKQVAEMLSGQFAELATCSIEGPIVEGRFQMYSFSTRVGTKG